MISTLLLSLTLFAAEAPVFEAKTADEASVVGSLVELTPEKAVLESPQGKVELESSKLLYLLPKNASEPSISFTPPSLVVNLSDGTALAAVQFVTESDKAKITLGDGAIVETPLKAVSHVRLQSETPKIASEWSRILGLKSEGDILVVRNGESVDYHQGVLHEITEDSVKFDLDGDSLPIKRAKIHGFIYRHPAGESNAPTLGYIVDRGGSRWAVSKFSLAEKLEWTTPGGVKFERPLQEIRSIDFSLGKVQYLSDLKPESVVWTPFFGQEPVSPMLERFYAPRMDRNFDSNPLSLRKTVFSKGLAMHSRTEIVYRLPDTFVRFKAVAGIDDSVGPKGNVRLTIRGDERVLFDSPVVGSDPPHNLDLDLTGVRRLTILVDYGETYGGGDHLILGNARIYK